MKSIIRRPSTFLTSIDPDSFFSQMDLAMRDFFGEALDEAAPNSLGLFERSAYPKLDIREEEKAFVVDVEVPGHSKEDVTVEVLNNVLVVRGQRKKEKEEKKGTFLRKELKHSSFSRQVCTLTENCDVENIDAEFKDGLLTVVIPKKVIEPPKPAVKQITIR